MEHRDADTWGDALHALIAAGHSRRDVEGCTLQQLRWWHAAEVKRQKRKRLDLLLLLRGAQATDEGFQQMLLMLDEEL